MMMMIVQWTPPLYHNQCDRSEKKITNSQLSRLTNISLFLFFLIKRTEKKETKTKNDLVRPLERLIMLTGKPSYHNYN